MTNILTTSKGFVAIRPAIADDAPLLHDLRFEALAGHPTTFAADADLSRAEPIERWVARIAEHSSSESGVICVASAEGQLVGMTGLGRGHWPKTRHSGIIWGVYVQAEWRGHGVAEALLRECMAWGHAHGVVVAKLGVTTTNTPAIRCYTRTGFTVYGLEPQAIYYRDAYYDELLMPRPTAIRQKGIP